MPAIQHLLQRWGFVKLDRYGLRLTSDGRILSTRPAVLDDGTGGRVVGWQDGDVSIWRLSRWPAASPLGSEVASRVAAPPAAAQPSSPPPAAVPASSAAGAVEAPASRPSRPSARVMRGEVAGEPVVDEDDWEWTIALARARVAVEEAEAARPPAPARSPAPAPRQPPAAARPPERPTPRPAVTKDPAASGEWPRTETIGAIDYEDYRISTRPAIAIPRVLPAVAIPRTTTPSTVIPVPAMPTVDAARCGRMEPVVRTAAPASRFAKGTGPVDPPTRRRTRPVAVVVEDTIPNLSVGDHTRPGVAPATRRMASVTGAELPELHDVFEAAPGEPTPPATGDRTRPGIALPPAARAVQLPSIKRRTAR